MPVPLQKGMSGEAKAKIIAAIIGGIATVLAAVLAVVVGYALTLKSANDAQTADTTALEQRISTLEAENQSLREEAAVPVETPSVDTSGLEQHIEELEAKIAEKDDTIARQQITIAQQQITIAERDVTIDGLRTQLENSDRSVTSAGNSNSTVLSVTPLSGSPDIWLCDMDDLASDAFWYNGRTESDNLNVKHYQCIYNLNEGIFYVLYYLGGDYSTLSGTFFRQHYRRNDGESTKLQFFDNETNRPLEFYDPETGVSLGDTLELGKADMPVSFAVNVSNVQVLKLQESGHCFSVAIGEAGLWLA